MSLLTVFMVFVVFAIFYYLYRHWYDQRFVSVEQHTEMVPEEERWSKHWDGRTGLIYYKHTKGDKETYHQDLPPGIDLVDVEDMSWTTPEALALRGVKRMSGEMPGWG